MTKFNFKLNNFNISTSRIHCFPTWLSKIDEGGLINELNLGAAFRTLVTKSKEEWHKINWKEAGAEIKDLQEKIVQATLQKKMKEVYRLQSVIIQKHSASALAIRKVITNKGGKTAGVDGKA